MTDQFVDTNKLVPAHELVQKWANETDYDERHWLYEIHIANRAAAWGAEVVDQGKSETYSFLLDTSRMDQLLNQDRQTLSIEQRSREFVSRCRASQIS